MTVASVPFSHDELVDRALHWLRARCFVSIRECPLAEQPDAFGWTYYARLTKIIDMGAPGMASDLRAVAPPRTYSLDEKAEQVQAWNTLTILVEVKVSRADFLADAEKPFRKNPADGMGLVRIYCAPRGMISREDLPERWGLLEPHGANMKLVVRPRLFVERNFRRESAAMLQELSNFEYCARGKFFPQTGRAARLVRDCATIVKRSGIWKAHHRDDLMTIAGLSEAAR